MIEIDKKGIKKERGRPQKDNVQLNMRYPRKIDEIVRSIGSPSDVIIAILKREFNIFD